MDSLNGIKDTAAQWIVRRGGENWSTTDEAELKQWLDASTGNLIAFLRLEAAWQEANRLKVLGAGFDRGVVPNLEDFRASPFFRHTQGAGQKIPEAAAPVSAARKARFIPWAAAASVLLVATVLTWRSGFFAGNVYTTSTGVVTAVPLSDGSKITLNTDSEIRVAVTDTERHVDLQQGEAFFEVVQDPARPFIVRAGNKRIIVLGTKFSVRRERSEVGIIVTEGKVRVEQAQLGSQAPSTQLSAGNVARAQDGSVAVRERTPAEAEELLSWRAGYVIFHETSLVDAAAVFNRYNTRKIVIEDSALADVSVSGNFRSTNVDSFVQLLEEGFPVIVQRHEGRIVLTRKPHIE